MILAVIWFTKDYLMVKDDAKKYPSLNYSDSISHKAISKFDWKLNGYRVSSNLCRIKTQIGNWGVRAIDNDTGIGAYYIINVGDSIVKKSNSDSLYVYKQDGRKILMQLLE